MLIAQISDLHVTAAAPDSNPLIDANVAAARAVHALNQLDPQPDVVIATGDLTDHGTPVEYELLSEILSAVVSPLYMIPGNHDDARVMLELFGGMRWFPVDALPCLYAIDDHAVRLVAIDTTLPDRPDGVFGDDRAGALAELLARSDRATLVFMHHPPFRTGIWWMDEVGLADPMPLRRVVEAHPQVVRIVSGHVHRPITTSWGGVPISVCPSTAHQVALGLSPDSVPQATAEPPAFQLHRWNGEGFVTHTAPVTLDVAVHDLAGLDGMLDGKGGHS